MSGDPGNPVNGSGYALLNALDRFRDDVREDLGSLETRLTALIMENRAALTSYSTTHNGVHGTERHETELAFTDSRAAHVRFDDFIASSRVAQAHRDGALGVTRYIVELVASNAGALIKIALSVAAGALIAAGGVHVSIG